MLPVISLGPLQIPVPQVTLILSLALGFLLAERWARRAGVPTQVLSDGLFWSLIAGLVAARGMYVLRYPEAFGASPWSVLSPNPGLLDPVGGVVGAALFLWVWAGRKGIALLRLLDGITPFLATVQVGLALYHTARGSFFGMPSRVPWALTFLGEPRHPTALYWALLALGILAWVAKRLKHRPEEAPAGWVFWPFVASSAGVYLFVEGLRGDARVLENGLRLGHVVVFPLFVVALWQWDRLWTRERSKPNRRSSSTKGRRGKNAVAS